MSEIIKLENVVWMANHNRRMVNDISFCIQEKERVMVCGGSGSGKDALMRLIAGMDKPSSGKVFVHNQAVHDMDSNEAASFRNRNIGIVQPTFGYMDRLSVAENISLPLIVRGIGRDQRKKAVEEMMKVLGIRHVAHANPAQLSTYETRVVSLARALITKPWILMMNDVTSCLSEKEAEKIVGTISAIFPYGDVTMLYFSDNANERLHTDRSIQIENGKIREDRK